MKERFSMSVNSAIKKFLIGLAAVLLVFANVGWAAGDTSDKDKADSDIAKRMDKAADVMNEIMGAPDNGIPDNILSGAKCIAIVPSMIKIAIGFGGSHGKGVATC